MYPRLEMHQELIRENIRKVRSWLTPKGIELVGVTKLLGGAPELASLYLEEGLKVLADARLHNLKKYQELACERMLLRPPSRGEFEEALSIVDYFLLSEITTITGLGQLAKEQQKSLKLILMVDLGDLREGIFDEDLLFESIEVIKDLPGVVLAGLGTNLACFSGVKPTRSHMNRLVSLAEKAEEILGRKLSILSGGNSSTLTLQRQEDLPSQVNQLRLGASLLMGIGYNDLPIKGLQTETFTLKAEIIELQQKPSLPEGERGKNALGEEVNLLDEGTQWRAIVALGRQEVNFKHLTPLGAGVKILGGSSDHMILRVPEGVYQVGDVLSFRPSYGGVLSLANSSYVSLDAGGKR